MMNLNITREKNRTNTMKNLVFNSIARQFSTSAKLLNKPLYLTPSKWLGLPPDQILDLHKQRKYHLGTNYRKNDDECKALMSTSEASRFTPQQIQRIYYQGEKAFSELVNHPLNSPNFGKPNTFDEYPLIARMKVRAHRERREYNRIAAYEMPHLVKYRQDYTKPKNKPITLKYTSILGEEELPINQKVVLTVKSEHLGLSSKELHKLRLLAGTRYDYRTDEIKMSTERFPESLQNTRYLLDTLKKLIKEAKDQFDSFEDIPLDKRHIFAKERKRKNKKHQLRDLKFPEEWKRPEDAPKKEKTLVGYLMDAIKN